MRQQSYKKFKGLQLLKNSFDTQGSLEVARNIVITQDDIIQSRRGRYFSHKMPDTQILNNVFIYRDRTFVVSQDTLYELVEITTASLTIPALTTTVQISFPSNYLQNGDFIVIDSDIDHLAGAFPNRFKDIGGFREVINATGVGFQFLADNPAQYLITTSLGIKISTYRRVTGVSFTVSSLGVGVSRNTKANKNLYFTTDNGVLKLEDPDQPILNAGVPESTDLTGVLVDTSPVKGRGFFRPNAQVAYRVTFARRDANNNLIESSPSPWAVFVNAANTTTSTSFVSPTLTVNFTAHGLATNDEIYVTDAVGGNTPNLIGFVFPVTVINPNQFTINVAGFGVTGAATSFSFGLKKNVRLRFAIPTGLSTEYTVNIYRTSFSSSATASPFDNFTLVDEINLTAAQIATLVGEYDDDVAEEVILSNSKLYTNSGEQGAFQLNNRPPYCDDLITWKNITFYANTKQYRFLELNLVAPTIIPNDSVITIAGSQYIFKTVATEVANRITTSPGTFSLGDVTVTQSGHGFSVGDVIFIYETTGFTGQILYTQKTITAVTATTFTFSAVPITAGSGDVRYQGLHNSANQYFVAVNLPTSGLNGRTLSESIDETARYLTAAVNINSSSIVSAVYLFDPDGSPGKIRFIAKSITTPTFSVTMNSGGDSFLPELPVSGTSVSDTFEEQPAGIYWSKLGQPEAVPLVNFTKVGEADKPILRLAPLRDSVIIIKPDGVYRINGDNPFNLSFIPLDTTVFCKASDSVRILNNSVYFLSNQGFVQVTDTSVRVVSRDIEPVVTATFSKNLEDITGAVSSETDRMYMCSTVLPNTVANISNVTRVYNYLTETWTDFDNEPAILFIGEIDSKDKIVGIPFFDRQYVVTERKNQNRLDYIEEEEAIYSIAGTWTEGEATLGSDDLLITVPYEHNYKVGDYVTITRPETSLTTLFALPTDIQFSRQITAISANNKVITVKADSISSGNGTGLLILSEGYREILCQADTTNGSIVVTMTTPTPHNLQVGDTVIIYVNNENIIPTFISASNVAGSRVITSVTSNTFTFDADVAASATATYDLVFSWYKKEPRCAVVTSVAPTDGDAVFSKNKIFQVVSKYTYPSTNLSNLNFVNNYSLSSFDFVKLGKAIQNYVRFSPINAENIGNLKQAPEFQCSFRNTISCSKMRVSFSTDSKVNAVVTNWDNLRDGKLATFGGWGQLPWGQFGWGAEASINREFQTQPAAILRTYLPLDAMLGTFVQVVLDHRRAGESIDLQSMSLLTEQATSRTSR